MHGLKSPSKTKLLYFDDSESIKLSPSNRQDTVCGESGKYISEHNQNAQNDGNRAQPQLFNSAVAQPQLFSSAVHLSVVQQSDEPLKDEARLATSELHKLCSYVYIYIQIYERETSVCMCCTITTHEFSYSFNTQSCIYIYK